MTADYAKYAILALLWIGFCTLHSLLISITVTRFLERKLGDAYRYYRLFYNLVALLTLVPPVWYSTTLHRTMLFTWDGYLSILQWLMRAAGVGLFVAGFMKYSPSEFLGTRQIRRGVNRQAAGPSGRLVSSGILAFVRHPFYSAVILLLWAEDFDAPRLIVNGILTSYVIIGTLLEEHKLLLDFGDQYRLYQREVSMFVPWKWIRLRWFDRVGRRSAPPPSRSPISCSDQRIRTR
ncbi:MAG: hypothetical protein AB1714_23595 [Acidobacteriota bacterium]